MKKTILSYLLLILIFFIKDEFYILVILALLIGLLFSTYLYIFTKKYKLTKSSLSLNISSIILISCFFSWLPYEYKIIDSLAKQRMKPPCNINNCYEVEYFTIKHYLSRNYRLSRDHKCVYLMSSHLSWPKFHLKKCNLDSKEDQITKPNSP